MFCISPTPVVGTFKAPPSKPLSQRYIFAAAIAEGVTTVGPLELSDDVTAALRAVLPLSRIELEGDFAKMARRDPDRVRAFNVGDSGFTLRVSTALYAGIKGVTVIYTSEQLSRRPLEDLVEALRIYADISWSPGVIRIESPGARRIEVSIRGDVTSQYISGLMYLSAAVEGGGRIRVLGGTKSWQYVVATAEVIKKFGGRVKMEDGDIYVEGPLKSPGRAEVPGDYALSSFLMVGAAITGGRVEVTGLGGEVDRAILDILREAGVYVKEHEDRVVVEGTASRPFEVDLSNAPDLAPPAALLASFIPGRSRLKGVEHLAYKESNRIETISDVVSRLGAYVDYKDGVLSVEGPPRAKNVEFKCHRDHRICLMALTAARSVGGCVNDVSSLAKTWPSALLYFSAR
ncbi:MAG: 3-phosphoshikimate 1-carboxyvinyltransferase [Thermoproteus sp.]